MLYRITIFSKYRDTLIYRYVSHITNTVYSERCMLSIYSGQSFLKWLICVCAEKGSAEFRTPLYIILAVAMSLKKLHAQVYIMP